MRVGRIHNKTGGKSKPAHADKDGVSNHRRPRAPKPKRKREWFVPMRNGYIGLMSMERGESTGRRRR